MLKEIWVPSSNPWNVFGLLHFLLYKRETWPVPKKAHVATSTSHTAILAKGKHYEKKTQNLERTADKIYETKLNHQVQFLQKQEYYV